MSLGHVHIDCASKGCYAVITVHPQEERRLRNTHETFYCPAGHRNYFAGKSEQEKVIDGLNDQLAWRDRQIERLGRQRETATSASRALVASVQTCPLGCGWKGARRLSWLPDNAEIRRFMDRAGGDLAAHLHAEHGAVAPDPVEIDA